MDGRRPLLDKSASLLREAEVDLKVGCFNKAVSAAYFSVRMAAEAFLLGMRTKKDDKIARGLKRLLTPILGGEGAEEVRLSFLQLFDMRKAADHRPTKMTREDAEFAVGRARELRAAILEAARRPAPGGG